MRFQIGSARIGSVALAMLSTACLLGGGLAAVAGWGEYKAEQYRVAFLVENPEFQLTDSEMAAHFGKVAPLVHRLGWLIPLALVGVGGLLVLSSIGLLAHKSWGLSCLGLAGWAGIAWFGALITVGALVTPEAESGVVGGFMATLLIGCTPFAALVVLARAAWLRRQMQDVGAA